MASRRLRAALETLGCRVNFSETDRLRGMLAAAGYQIVGFDEEADLYVVNTCTVTHVADRKSRQMLRRARRRNPRAVVAAVGCYADVAAPALRAIAGVDLVLDQHEEPSLLPRAAAMLQARGLEPPPPGTGAPVMCPSAPSRVLIKVQDGCDNRCAYCVVRLARGPSRSRPADEILAEVRAAEQAGYPEIVLTGINLGAYHDERAGNLAGLARRILEETDIGRIRFSSIEPQDLPPELLDLWPEPRLCRHLHLPLQSGADRTLRRMGRPYRLDDFRSLVETIHRRVPDIGLTTDVIVGFPGETAEDHVASLTAIAALPLSDLHIFPFSSRPGTAAAALPDPVPAPVIRRRSVEMHHLAGQMAHRFRQRYVGQELPVLWDGPCAAGWTGLSDNYLRVVTHSQAHLLARVTSTRLLALEGDTLIGQPTDDTPRPPCPRSGRAVQEPSRQGPRPAAEGTIGDATSLANLHLLLYNAEGL